ncbi:MAG: AtpZ/AtpI family protein [Armatimonadota bacterium]
MQRRQRELARKLAGAEERKLRARRRPEESVWFGLGTFGLVGWSVAVPTLVCLAIGIWIDSHYQSRFSWTLILLFAGITIGCLNAWYWVTREREQIERRRDEDDGG